MVRFKNRYLILYVKAKDGRAHDAIGAALLTSIRNSMVQQHGEAGLEAAASSLQVMFYHHLAGVAVVRSARSEHQKVLQACLKMTVVDGRAVNVRLLKLTGAFRVAKQAAGEHIERLVQVLKLNPDALELRDSDPEKAVELLGQVLEIRNKAFGEKAFECADTYLYYGELLFEQAQASSDYFGDQMKSAAVQRAKKIAEAEGKDAGGQGDGAEAESSEEGDDAAADDENEADPKPTTDAAAAAAAQPAADETPAEAAETAPATAKPDQQAEPAEAADKPAAAAAAEEQQPNAEEAIAAEATAATEQQDKEQQPAAEGSDAAEQQDAEAMDEDEDAEAGDGDEAGEDVSSEDADADADATGDNTKEAVEVTGESDDMALAWEMLEMARIIYNDNGGAASHANKLADCHMYIGDILCEQEKFEEAVTEYNAATDLLAQVEGGLPAHKRRAAELDFKKATALQLSDQPAEALAVMKSAKTHLQARIDELCAQLATSAGGSTSAAAAAADAASAAAFAAFAAVVSSYTKPAEEGASKDGVAADQGKASEQDDAAAAAAKQKLEVAEIKGAIDSINDRIEELTAAVEAHMSMKETLRNTFAMVAAGGGPEGEEKPAAAAPGGAESSAAAAAAAAKPVESVSGFSAPTGQTGPAVDIGVIGKGKRVAPTPAAAPAEAGDDQKQHCDGAGEGGSGKKRNLSDLVSGDQEGKDDVASAADEAAAVKAAAAAAGQLAAAASKKARA